MKFEGRDDEWCDVQDMRPRMGAMYEYGYWMYDIDDLTKSFGVRLVIQPYNVQMLVRLLGWD